MTIKELFSFVSQDYRRIVIPHNLENRKLRRYLYFIYSLIAEDSMLYMFWFRIGSYLKEKRNPIAKLFYGICATIHKFNSRILGVQIPLGTRVSGGFYIGHYSCIVVTKYSTIGVNCTILQGVTVGMNWASEVAPVIGNNCILCAGCKVIGNVRLGNNVIVGANAVVTKDVPDNCVVAGIPAKVISTDSKKCIKGNQKKWLPI